MHSRFRAFFFISGGNVFQEAKGKKPVFEAVFGASAHKKTCCFPIYRASKWTGYRTISDGTVLAARRNNHSAT